MPENVWHRFLDNCILCCTYVCVNMYIYVCACIILWYCYIMSRFPNDERVEACTVGPGGDMGSRCPLWAWASWWSPADHLKVQRDRQIFFSFLSLHQLNWPAQNSSYAPKNPKRSATWSGCSHETGGRWAISLKNDGNQQRRRRSICRETCFPYGGLHFSAARFSKRLDQFSRISAHSSCTRLT